MAQRSMIVNRVRPDLDAALRLPHRACQDHVEVPQSVLVRSSSLVACGSTRGWWSIAIASSLVCNANIAPSDAILIENFDPDYLLFERATRTASRWLCGKSARANQHGHPSTSEPNAVALDTAEVMASIARLGPFRYRPNTRSGADLSQRSARHAALHRAGAHPLGASSSRRFSAADDPRWSTAPRSAAPGLRSGASPSREHVEWRRGPRRWHGIQERGGAVVQAAVLQTVRAAVSPLSPVATPAQ